MILAVLVGLAVGYYRGLMGVVVGLVGYLVSLFVAGRFAGPLVAWQEPRLQLIRSLAGVLHRNIRLPQDLAQMPLKSLPAGKVAQVISFLPLPDFYKAYLISKVTALAHTEGSRTVADVLFTQIATGILGAVAFAVIMMAAGWALAVLARRISVLLDHLPLVGAANRWLGALVGAAEVVVGAAMLLALLHPVLALPFAERLAKAVAESRTADLLMEVYAALAGWVLGRGNAFFLGF